MADAGLFEELVAAENDLIDSYVRGSLEDEERRAFEAEFLKSPERRERVAFADSLNKVCALAKDVVPAETTAPRKRKWYGFYAPPQMPQWAWAAAVVVIVALGSWLAVRSQRLGVQLRQALAGQAELRHEEDTLRQHVAELERSAKAQTHEDQTNTEVAKLETPTGSEVTVELTPGIARGPGERHNDVVVHPTTAKLRLELMLERGGYENYNTVLLTSERKELLRGERLPSHTIRGNVVVAWSLPVGSIPSGDYVVQLTGKTAAGSQEDLSSYSFRILRDVH